MAISTETSTKLRQLLSSWTVFYQKAHTYHWDLRGVNFLELHKFFDTLYSEAVSNADAIAERLRQIGVPIRLSLATALGESVVKDENSAGSAEEMVRDLIVALAQLTVLQSEIYVEAEEQGDYVTVDLTIQLSKWNEMQSWFLAAVTNEENISAT